METDIGVMSRTIVRLETDRRFGYVCDSTGARFYIFVVGTAISMRDAVRLRVGAKVRFVVVGQGRVERLQLVAAWPPHSAGGPVNEAELRPLAHMSRKNLEARAMKRPREHLCRASLVMPSPVVEFDITEVGSGASPTWHTIFSDVTGEYRSGRTWTQPPSFRDILQHLDAFTRQRPGGVPAAVGFSDGRGMAEVVDALVERNIDVVWLKNRAANIRRSNE